MRFEEFLNLSNESNDEKEIANWNNVITDSENFFNYLCADNNIDWTKCGELLQIWRFDVIETEIEYEKKQAKLKEKIKLTTKHNKLIKQWEHAVKLFICAKYIAENKSQLPKDFETSDDKFTLLTNFRQQTTNDFKRFSVEIEENEIKLLCSIFHSKSLPSDIREIPIVTAPEDPNIKGMIHILELRKVKSYGVAIQNPCVFPQSNLYANEIDRDFRDAIQTALKVTILSWNSEIASLEKKITAIESRIDHQEEDDLNFLKKELSEMINVGNINQYGIIWDVKPYYKDTKTNKLHGESIGLAASVGFYHILRGTFPDDRVLFSAKWNLDTNSKICKLGDVGKIPRKIEAAIKTKYIDTFVLHEKNFKSNGKEEIKDLLKDEKNFRLIILDENGNEKDVFPKVG